MSLRFFPSWLKSKAGIVGLASIIIAPAGAVAIRAQTQDDPASSVQTEASNSNAAAQSTDPGQSSSAATSSVNQTTNGGSTQTSVTVDDQTIDVPANGSVHKEIKTANGSTIIDITTKNSSSSNSSSNSSQNSLHVSTRSTSTQKSEGQSVSN